MALMSLRNSSHVKASVVLTRVDNLFIHNYIRSLLNIIGLDDTSIQLEPASYLYTACVSDA